jgi:hypothetical protein
MTFSKGRVESVKDQLFMLYPDSRSTKPVHIIVPTPLPIEGQLGFFPELRRLVDAHYQRQIVLH